MKPREGWGFWLVTMGATLAMLGLCFAARCHGDYTVGCPAGRCPVPQQPQWQAPQWTPVPPLRQAPQSQANPAVCRIRNSQGNGSAMGSGTLVDASDGYGLVVTAQHIFREGVGVVTCEFPSGRRLKAVHVADKDHNDIAALLIADPGVKPVEVAPEGPQLREFAASAGYGSTNRYLVNTGFVTRIHGTQFELSGRARGGDSGGPVFDRRGRLIGVLWGTDGRCVIATSSVTTDGFLQRAGRYLLPYRKDIDNRLDGMQGQINGLQNQPPPQIIMPPQQGQCPVTDLGPTNARIDDLVKRQDALEARQDKVRDTAEALAKKYEDKLPGITKDLEKAVTDSADAKEGLIAALDEDNPKGLLGRVKARLDERLGGIFDTLPWLKYGMIGLAVGLGYLFMRKEGAKAAAGEDTLWQRIAARTPTEIDDKIAAKVAAGQAALHERLAGLHGTVANLADTVRSRVNPPPPPATGA